LPVCSPRDGKYYVVCWCTYVITG